MKCPLCHQEMEIEKKGTSTNSETTKQYYRTLYHCNKCDTWANVEVPKAES